MEGSGRDLIGGRIPEFPPEGLRKTTINFIQNNR
jgi:hypothetical protein